MQGYPKLLYCTIVILVCTVCLSRAMEERVETGALLELKGKIWHGAGQGGVTGFDGFENYWNIAPPDQKPNLFMDYAGTWHCNERWSLELKQELLKYHRQGYYVIPQVGMNVFYLWQQYISGEQDDEVDNYIKGLKYLGMPVFLRVGYEFNNFPGDPWLTPYKPEEFIQVWKAIVKKIKDAGVEVACVWNVSLSGDQYIMEYYPGNEWIDWMGFNVFSSDIAGGAHSTMLRMVNAADSLKKPVMIGEASPNRVNQVNYGDWDLFYGMYFKMIADRPTIKQMCYINWDWDIQDMVGGNGMFPWGDARLQMPGSVKDQFFTELKAPEYLHATNEKETRSYFNYDDDTAPPKVSNLKRDGKLLKWDGVTDVGESGLAHYTIYKDGKLWDYICETWYPVQDLYQGKTAKVTITAMDRAGNESPKSNELEVDLDETYELIWDGEFNYPATSLALDWKWMGTQDGGAKPGPDELLIDTTGKLSGKNSTILPDYKLNDQTNQYWKNEITEKPADWKVQLFQSFNVQKDQKYHISFKAVAKEPISIKLYFMDNHVDPLHTHFHAGQDPNFDTEWEFYKIWNVDIGTEPQDYSFEHVAPHSECARLSFMMGKNKPTTIWFDAVSVKAIDGPIAINNTFGQSTKNKLNLRVRSNVHSKNLKLQYHLDTKGATDINLYTVEGKLIKQISNKFDSAGDHTIRWDASELAAGIYLIQLKAAMAQQVVKFSIVN